MHHDQEKNHNAIGTVILVTSACMLLFMLNNGIRANFGLLSSALHTYTNASIAVLNNAVAIAQLLYGLSQPFFGVLALKKSNSFVLGLGGILMGAGLLLVSLSGNAIIVYVALGILVGLAAGALAFGVVMGAATPVVGERYAAVASGIINGGGGLGGAVLAPFMQAMSDYGFFTEGMFALAALSGAVMLLCVWLNQKECKALLHHEEKQTAPSVKEMLKDAFTSRQYMHLALAFFTCGFFMAIIESYLYPQLISYDFKGAEIAFLFSLYGIMGTIGPIIAGILCVRFNAKWVLGTIYGLRPILILLFLFLPKTSLVVYGFIIGLGLTGNATVPPTTLLIAKFFGNAKMPTLSGIAMVFHQIGSFLSTWLGGLLIRSSGDYTSIWLCSACTAAAAAILCYTVNTSRSHG